MQARCMIQTNRYDLIDLEQKILILIEEAGKASVKEVHHQLEGIQFIDIMRNIHKFHTKDYLLQTHVEYEAFYRLKVIVLTKLRKTILHSNV